MWVCVACGTELQANVVESGRAGLAQVLQSVGPPTSCSNRECVHFGRPKADAWCRQVN